MLFPVPDTPIESFDDFSLHPNNPCSFFQSMSDTECTLCNDHACPALERRRGTHWHCDTPECSKVFYGATLDREQLDTHIRSKHPMDEVFSCDKCGKQFAAARYKKAHDRTCSNPPPLFCVRTGSCNGMVRKAHRGVSKPVHILNGRCDQSDCRRNSMMSGSQCRHERAFCNVSQNITKIQLNDSLLRTYVNLGHINQEQAENLYTYFETQDVFCFRTDSDDDSWYHMSFPKSSESRIIISYNGVNQSFQICPCMVKSCIHSLAARVFMLTQLGAVRSCLSLSAILCESTPPEVLAQPTSMKPTKYPIISEFVRYVLNCPSWSMSVETPDPSPLLTKITTDQTKCYCGGDLLVMNATRLNVMTSLGNIRSIEYEGKKCRACKNKVNNSRKLAINNI